MPTGTLAPPEPALLTADEFFDRHGDESHVDLVDGVVVRYPMPGMNHGRIALKLGRRIGNYVEDHDLGNTFTCDTLIRVKRDPDRMRGADFAYLSYARWPADQAMSQGYMVVMPELVAEVKSPCDSWPEVLVKVRDYLDAGVQVVLVLDPATKAIKRYHIDGEKETIPESGTLTLPELFPDFACPVAGLFQ